MKTQLQPSHFELAICMHLRKTINISSTNTEVLLCSQEVCEMQAIAEPGCYWPSVSILTFFLSHRFPIGHTAHQNVEKEFCIFCGSFQLEVAM